MPEVSIIIPVYNAEKFIKKTIESVLSQTYKDYEIIIVDDGSTDNSKKILDEFKDKVRYFKQANSGVSSARNRAIKEAKGEYIALLDQDDLWYSEKLKKQINFIKKNPNAGMVYSDCYYIDDKDKVISRVFENQKFYCGKIFENLVIENFIPIPTVLIKKEVLNKTGLFVENYSHAEEYDLFLRISKDYEVGFMNEALAGYRVHDTNLSKNIDKSLQEDIIVKEYTLKKYAKQIEPVKNKIKRKLAEHYYELGRFYQKAGQGKMARQCLAKSIKTYVYSYKQYLCYILTGVWLRKNRNLL